MPASASVPGCPGAGSHRRTVVASHPEQGWILPCTGLVLFDDGGELLPASRRIIVTAAA
ncbi:MAG: hypothetical protein JO345_41720 [Streptosporangiaceae bacterium]|nr:hypothetical protein [Streptosporangiaceae bacterium]